MSSRKGVKTLEEILEFLKTRREFSRENFGVRSLKVFGSYTEGRANEDSDLDLLVSFKEGATLFTLLELKEYLENALGLRVDVVSESRVKSLFKTFYGCCFGFLSELSELLMTYEVDATTFKKRSGEFIDLTL